MEPSFTAEVPDSLLDLESSFRSCGDLVFTREEYSIPDLLMNGEDQGMPNETLGSMVYGGVAGDVGGASAYAGQGVSHDSGVGYQYAGYPTVTVERRQVDEGDRSGAQSEVAGAIAHQVTRNNFV